MKYIEENRDLFSVSDDYYLAHCISADFALGAGIAIEFNKRFDMRRKLRKECPDYWEYMQRFNLKGQCILIDNVLNLVTKEKYWHKPTYKSLEQALLYMKAICMVNNIKKVAMPTIASGLDRLDWDKVSKLIRKTFENIDVEILVCKK